MNVPNTVKVKEGILEAAPFTLLPVHDTIWALTAGFDGKIYAGACGEFTGGLSAFVVRYDPQKRSLDYLTEVGTAIGEPPDNGHCPHSKVHKSMLPLDEEHLLCATHCTGPPLGDSSWNPWRWWGDPVKSFSGFHIFLLNTRTGEVSDRGVKAPNEGSRCMALDHKRRKAYGVTYPRDHFYVYYIDEDRYVDLGRIGDDNPQCIFLDQKGNAYTFDDLGFLIKCDAETNRLQHLDVQLPHAPFRDGTMNVIYDARRCPKTGRIYGVTWGFDNRLWRYDPEDGPQGRLEDLGHAYGSAYEDWQRFDQHAGGLVFDSRGMLYFAHCVTKSAAEGVKDVDWEGEREGYLVRLNPDTLEREEICHLQVGDRHAGFISRAARDAEGNLYFADVGASPPGLYIYRPEGEKDRGKASDYIRVWG